MGGIKEKTIAARRSNIQCLVFPQGNKRDFDELPDYLKDGLEVSCRTCSLGICCDFVVCLRLCCLLLVKKINCHYGFIKEISSCVVLRAACPLESADSVGH